MKCAIHKVESDCVYRYLGVKVPACNYCIKDDAITRKHVFYPNNIIDKLKSVAIDTIKGLTTLDKGEIL